MNCPNEKKLNFVLFYIIWFIFHVMALIYGWGKHLQVWFSLQYEDTHVYSVYGTLETDLDDLQKINIKREFTEKSF